jgi:hypothetical protein
LPHFQPQIIAPPAGFPLAALGALSVVWHSSSSSAQPCYIAYLLWRVRSSLCLIKHVRVHLHRFDLGTGRRRAASFTCPKSSSAERTLPPFQEPFTGDWAGSRASVDAESRPCEELDRDRPALRRQSCHMRMNTYRCLKNSFTVVFQTLLCGDCRENVYTYRRILYAFKYIYRNVMQYVALLYQRLSRVNNLQ